MAKTPVSSVADKQIQSVVAKKPKTNYKLTKKQRDTILREYATGTYTMRELARNYDCTHSNIAALVKHNKDTFDQYKKENVKRLEVKLGLIGNKALKQANKRLEELSPYQSFMVGAISYDKLAPKTAINIGDNRSITVQYPNWYGSKQQRRRSYGGNKGVSRE